jgi:catechol 2,3-dioxygenase-like lactoylglutathione lyase family enzyme
MTETIQRVVPVFRIFDLEKAKDFYLGFLGFNLDWEHRLDTDSPLYLQVSRGAFQLHLSEHHGDGTPGSVVFVQMEGLEGYHGEITAKGYRYMRPGIEDRPWAMREMTVIDPFGNRLRFSEKTG